ncbi:hypothetical protein [Natrinema halophilum]|uniref:Major facilitator superfamily (MFS) profile domain-containing protein n=1 Tax=Natrinema halophilum TaxID=1699371 RepID=A0A7D5H9V5_9EURY|nr:hypothetical protein [Natrinema halophilum]QLG50475.1 hypothetical protein HYG82_17280 [Natrinema halophilum]
MDDRSIAGLLATLVIAALAVLGVYGFSNGYLINSSDYLTSTVGALVVAILAVGSLIGLGAGSKRWRENPYW